MDKFIWQTDNNSEQILTQTSRVNGIFPMFFFVESRHKYMSDKTDNLYSLGTIIIQNESYQNT